jgi:hypothetical protein
VPKTDGKVQKVDRATSLPLWTVELTGFTNEEDGTAVLAVNVASAQAPLLSFREPVEVVELEMNPWAQVGREGDLRSGVSFRAKEIRPLNAAA